MLSLNRLSVFAAFRCVVLIFLPFNRLVNEMSGRFPVTSDVRILNIQSGSGSPRVGTGMEMVGGVFSFKVIMSLLLLLPSTLMTFLEQFPLPAFLINKDLFCALLQMHCVSQRAGQAPGVSQHTHSNTHTLI